MGNSIRCCIACMLPCGALDVVRVVHTSGRVQHYVAPVTAGHVMNANPCHLLAQPTATATATAAKSVTSAKLLVLPADALLQRGHIYFLIPVYAVRPNTQPKPKPKTSSNPNPNPKAKLKLKPKREAEAEAIAVAMAMAKKAEQQQQQQEQQSSPPDQQHCSSRGRHSTSSAWRWRPVLQSISEVEPI